MALGTMGYTKQTISVSPEILLNSEYVGVAVTLDTTSFTSGICKAGTPIASDGTLFTAASGQTALGILLHDVYSDRPQGTAVQHGWINSTVATTHASVTYSTAIKSALPLIVFG